MAKTLFFGNLPWSVTSEDLARLVSEHAEVISARVITDRDTGRSRGFGFVEVADEAAAGVIEALNGYELNGRQLTVNEAQPRPERGDNGGRGRTGGARGGPRRGF
ncbi:MAG: RNA-binding protein [Bacillota bacterium]